MGFKLIPEIHKMFGLYAIVLEIYVSKKWNLWAPLKTWQDRNLITVMIRRNANWNLLLREVKFVYELSLGREIIHSVIINPIHVFCLPNPTTSWFKLFHSLRKCTHLSSTSALIFHQVYIRSGFFSFYFCIQIYKFFLKEDWAPRVCGSPLKKAIGAFHAKLSATKSHEFWNFDENIK